MNRTCTYSIELMLVLMCASLPLASTPRTAHAVPPPPASTATSSQDATAGQCLAVPVVDVLIPDRGGSFHVTISPVFPTMVRFPEGVDFGDSLTTYDKFKVSRFENTVIIRPTTQLPKSLKTNVLLTTKKVETTMNLSVADPPTKMSSLVMVTPVPAAEFETRKTEMEKRQSEHDADRKLAYRKNIALVLLELKQLLTESPPVAALGMPAGAGKRSYAREGDTVAVLTWAVSVQSDRYLKVTVDNQTAERIELENAWLREGKRYSEEAVFVPAPGTETAKDRIAIVPPYGQVTGMVLVPDHVKTPLDELKVQLLGPAAVPTLIAAEIVELYPMPPDERRRRRQEKQLALSVRLLGGAMWLGDGARLDMIGGAVTSGLGVRLTKGMHRNFAFEAELAVGGTGEIRFDDVMWDATAGDISRDALFGRLLFSGQLRFGDKIQPHVQFGLGFQGARHDSRFIPQNGSERDGPDGGMALDLLWSIGAGVTMRINEHWTAGVIMSGVGVAQSLNSDTLRGAFEGGLYFGYGWNL